MARPSKGATAPAPELPAKISGRDASTPSRPPANQSGPSALIGAHVPKGRSFADAVAIAASISCDSFALFLGQKLGWNIGAMPTEKQVAAWHAALKEHGYSTDVVLPHAGYLINLAQPDDEKWEKSVKRLTDECEVCARLGVPVCNVHPGSTTGKSSRDEGIQRIARALERILRETRTGDVSVVLELTAGSKNGAMLGSTLEDMRDIIAATAKDVRGRVAVCVDTCHCHAAGYDLTNDAGVDNFFKEFDKIIGLDRLKGLHLNDAKSAKGSKLDRHEDVGLGQIGLAGLAAVIRHPAARGLPACLETHNDYRRQIIILKRLLAGEPVAKSECVYVGGGAI